MLLKWNSLGFLMHWIAASIAITIAFISFFLYYSGIDPTPPQLNTAYFTTSLFFGSALMLKESSILKKARFK